MKKTFFAAAVIAAFAAAFILGGCSNVNTNTASKLPEFPGVFNQFYGEDDSIVTNAKVGDTVEVYTPNPAGLHYEWQRGGSADGPFAKIPGSQDSSQYTVTASDQGKYIVVYISRDGFSGKARSTTVLGPIAAGDRTLYTVTFKADGNTVHSVHVPEGDMVSPDSVPGEPFKSGFHFDGWYLDDDLFDFDNISIEDNIILNAKWTQSFIADVRLGGLAKEGQTIAAVVTPGSAGLSYKWERSADDQFEDAALISGAGAETYTLVSADVEKYVRVCVTRIGYWGEQISANVFGPVQDSSAAQWTVTFTDADASFTQSISIVNGTRVSPPDDPVKEGCRFDGWFYTSAGSGPQFDFTAPITGATTIYAKWTAAWLVTFDTNGGSGIASVYVESGHVVTRPANPTKPDMLFYKWYSNPGLTTEFNFVTTTITAPTTIYAKWWTIVKKINFDDFTDSSDFKQTASGSGSAAALEQIDIWDFQRGGADTGITYAVSGDQNHTPGGSKSFKWGGAREGRRVKFDKIFSPADYNKNFKISVWVYNSSGAAVQLRLATYRVSDVTTANFGDGTTVKQQAPLVTLSPNTWTEMTWDYSHNTPNDIRCTQLAVGTLSGDPAFSATTIYIDDIVIAVEDVSGTPVQTKDFEVSSFALGTDWEGANLSSAEAELSTEYFHGGAKSIKFHGRSANDSTLKFKDTIPAAAGTYSATAWVYNPGSTVSWVYLAVYQTGSAAWAVATATKDVVAGNNPVTRQISRVAPGWNKVELRGYVQTAGSAFTQLGIAQPAGVPLLGALYIDDIAVVKNW